MARPTITPIGRGIIYSIVDNGSIVYVGQTTKPKKRFQQHRSIAQNRGNTQVKKWLYSQLSQGKEIVINVIEVTNSLDRREKFWIKHFKSKGDNLLNMTCGGFDRQFLKRAKQSKPWSKSLSPIQRRLKVIQQGILFHKRKGNFQKVSDFEDRYVVINDSIRKVGSDVINNKLWLKYGR